MVNKNSTKLKTSNKKTITFDEINNFISDNSTVTLDEIIYTNRDERIKKLIVSNYKLVNILLEKKKYQEAYYLITKVITFINKTPEVLSYTYLFFNGINEELIVKLNFEFINNVKYTKNIIHIAFIFIKEFFNINKIQEALGIIEKVIQIIFNTTKYNEHLSSFVNKLNKDIFDKLSNRNIEVIKLLLDGNDEYKYQTNSINKCILFGIKRKNDNYVFYCQVLFYDLKNKTSKPALNNYYFTNEGLISKKSSPHKKSKIKIKKDKEKTKAKNTDNQNKHVIGYNTLPDGTIQPIYENIEKYVSASGPNRKSNQCLYGREDVVRVSPFAKKVKMDDEVYDDE